MEITQDQFTSNVGQMAEAQQAQVMQLIEQNEPPVLRAFAASLGVTLTMGEEQAPLAPSEEVGGEPPLLPRERNLQEMQQFDNRMDPDPDPDPDVSDPAAFPGQVTAPGAREVQATPVQNQMQQLALGDQVAGMIEQPGAENETGVADDVPMDAPEGAFIINASAIAKVGRLDFEKRILAPAIEELKREGVNIELASLKSPSNQVNGAVDIAVSNKEYYIPPELAEMIGTDLLEKINKRGEAETEKKLKEQQEQQPQQQEQAARPGQRQIPVRGAKGIDGVKKKVKLTNQEILQNQKRVYDKLKGEGLREEAVAGIMGNIHAENDTFEYQRVEEGKTKNKGYGIFQFTGGRKKAYDNYLSAMGKTDSLDSQVEYALDSINITAVDKRDKANFPSWETYDLGYGNRQDLRKAFATGSAEEVANKFLDLFERPKEPEKTRKKRVSFANRIYNSAKTLFSIPSPNNSSPEGRTPLALEEQQSFMSQSNGKEVSPISDKELQGLEKDASTVTYIAK